VIMEMPLVALEDVMGEERKVNGDRCLTVRQWGCIVFVGKG